MERYSSRRSKLDRDFLSKKLSQAKSYDRIAGYFSSSIMEVAGEHIEQVSGKVRVLCNSSVEQQDIMTAKAAEQAQQREWCALKPEKIFQTNTPRLEKLYTLIKSGKLEVKVVPNDVFGLIHGKAGVITYIDDSKTAFLGSINETYAAWKMNYELLWEDDSEDAVRWVQEEFDYFWHHPAAVPLASFVVEDIKRITNRIVTPHIEDWKADAKPAEVVVESPVYRQELGLWEHQKAFIQQVFHDHKKHGARYVLADQVGLGKTVQLAMSAQLMALYGEDPVLILAPKTLLSQWQDEMMTLLALPSAIWLGKCWQDENGVVYPETDDIRKCPRRVGIISQGLIVNGREELHEQLLKQKFECVIVDEAHRARRTNLGDGKEEDSPKPNNLMRFLLKISLQTKSMLLATATPVQMYPIEAWDLLNILSQKDDSVLGSPYSMWRTQRKRALDFVTGKESPDMAMEGLREQGEWLRNPLPPAAEDPITFGQLRRVLRCSDDEFVVSADTYDAILSHNPPARDRVHRILQNGFIIHHNPFIRHIIRRTRSFLESAGQLPKIDVILYGENDEESIPLFGYLKEAYTLSEVFCQSLGQRIKGGGFIKTMLLKRMGSSMLAGRKTAEKMLAWDESSELFTDDEDEYDETQQDSTGTRKETLQKIQSLTGTEREVLKNLIQLLDAHVEDDPKYELLIDILLNRGFANRGCIIFSQYFDTISWFAERLSAKEEFSGEYIGLYAGSNRSGIYERGIFHRESKDVIKKMVREHKIHILMGTDAASEGLNLQTLGSLINLDLPWNPTRLEQRKGRIQRIGQIYKEIYIYNMRYRGSVEDRVHALLSRRLQEISNMFGQLPDVLQDVWIEIALNNEEAARKIIDEVPTRHPFELRYADQSVRHIDWESCSTVLDEVEKRKFLIKGWDKLR